MPVRKFRSIEEMKQPRWRTPGDPELYLAIADLWEFGQLTSSRRFTPGVHRFRSIEEMKRSRDSDGPEADSIPDPV